MRKVILCLLVSMFILVISLGSCTLEMEDPGYGYSNNSPHVTAYVETHAGCFEEPYWQDPEWCDLFSDGECCTWYVDYWYEEWCDWGYMGCWEYNGAF
jgi:hypothetical protein